jgi:hypothetical protein
MILFFYAKAIPIAGVYKLGQIASRTTPSLQVFFYCSHNRFDPNRFLMALLGHYLPNTYKTSNAQVMPK